MQAHHNHKSARLTMSRSFWTQVIPAKVQALDGVPGDCLFLALDALCAAAVLNSTPDAAGSFAAQPKIQICNDK